MPKKKPKNEQLEKQIADVKAYIEKLKVFLKSLVDYHKNPNKATTPPGPGPKNPPGVPLR